MPLFAGSCPGLEAAKVELLHVVRICVRILGARAQQQPDGRQRGKVAQNAIPSAAVPTAAASFGVSCWLAQHYQHCRCRTYSSQLQSTGGSARRQLQERCRAAQQQLAGLARRRSAVEPFNHVIKIIPRQAGIFVQGSKLLH
ncbi:hypothetical protein ABPG75_002729 [Micractinium tetrahymenae]